MHLKVYGVVFDPFGVDPTTFMSYGVNHIKWWTKQAGASGTFGKFVETSGTFGIASKHTVMSAVWLSLFTPSTVHLSQTPNSLNPELLKFLAFDP
jgi:hypothetical protein